jgi:membrane protease YdiL (CAAX protease family)
LKILVVIVGFLTFVPAQLGAALVLPTVGDTFSYRDVVPRGRFGTFAVLYLALSAALVEEVFYRGVLARLVIGSRDTALKRHLFVAVSAILFGVNHWSQGLPQVVATIYLGVVAAFLYLRLRNLWYVIGGHLVLNLLTMR